MNDKTKKITAIIMLILILLNSISLNSYAKFITDMNSDASFGVISGTYANYGHELHYANYDGTNYLLFCMEYGQKSPTGKTYSYNGEFLNQYKEQAPQYQKIAEMIYFGYTMDHGMGLPCARDIQAACCTQQYVWESLGHAPSRDSWKGGSMSSSIYANWLSSTEAKYNQYHSNVSFNGVTLQAGINETAVFTDTNGVLAHFEAFNKNVNGINYIHENGSNQLKATLTSSANAGVVSFNSKNYNIYELMPNGAKYDSTTMSNYMYIHFNNGAVQDLIFSNYVDPVTFTANVEVLSCKVKVKKLNKIGNVISGCKFGLYTDSSCKNKVAENVTDANGEILFENLKPGTYFVKEISVVNGYLLNEPAKQVSVPNGQTMEVSFENEEPTGSIRMIKTDKYTGNLPRVDGTVHHGDATLNGAVYTLYAGQDIYNVAKTIKYFNANDKIAEFKFDENGKATITITNDKTMAKLVVDGDTLKGLPLGSYYAKETTTPTGYTEDKTTHKFDLKYKDMNTKTIDMTQTAEEEVKRAKFNVIKISSNENKTADTIKDAEFTAILSKYVKYYGSFDEAKKHLSEFYPDEYSVFKTDENGHGLSGLLAYGEYEVRETVIPNDKIETVEPFYININKDSDGSIKEFVENDFPFESYIKLIKEDKTTGKKVTLSNATFKLYRLNDKNQWEKVYCKNGIFKVDSWKTGKDGIAYTEDKLIAGKYKADEIKIPDGFLKLDSPVEFEINRSNKTLEFDKDYDAYISVVLKNEQPTGTLKLDKTIAIRNDVDTSLVDTSDLSKIKFKLAAKENIIDKADGKVIYAKGKEVGTYNLTKDGKLEISKLPMGKYELQEIETLSGLVLDNTKYEVNFKKTDDTTKVYTIENKIKNDTTCVEISKTDITGDKELKGAKLSVIDENNKVIDSWTSTDKTHKIEGLLVGKTYILREEIAPEGFVKATDIKFTIANNNKIQKVKMIDKVVTMSKKDIGGKEIEGAKIQVLDKDNKIIDEWTSTKEEHKIKNLVENETYRLHEEVAPNGYVKASDITFKVTEDKKTQKVSMIDKIVEISKTDITTGKKLENAKLTVTDENGKVVDEWTSTKESHKVTGLEEGKKYTLTETTCPYGYEQAESITFEVSKDKETQKIEMKDQPILKNVKVIKIDTDTKEQIKEKFVFGIYKDSECKNLIQEVKSNKDDGFVEFKDLRYGTYFIKELDAPNGYTKSDRVAKVEINDKGIFVDDNQVEEKDSTIEFNFENKHIEIPKTGDNTHIKLAIGIIILAVLGIIYIWIKNHMNK